ARCIDVDVKGLKSVLLRAASHKGAAFIEVLQNCNVFNDGAFAGITKKDARAAMLINLEHGEPIRFGPELERGVMLDEHGLATIVDIADVGEDRLLVHDVAAVDPSLAFALSRLSHGPDMPTPMGIFRQVDRPEYVEATSQQLAASQEQKGPGDLETLLHSLPTWDVD
ncbi:MAG: 2-oxoacid:ferredoxin oxidoreductase subunit beta, partial [Acidimicrobiia bacterium]|nr:2-oxoacid:ferredoxin oxidoreductase subunit beta [Acidimicrobiia bacterium]